MVVLRPGPAWNLRSVAVVPPRRTGRRGSTPITEKFSTYRSVVRDPGVRLYLALQNGVWRWRLGRWSSHRHRPDPTRAGHLGCGRTFGDTRCRRRRQHHDPRRGAGRHRRTQRCGQTTTLLMLLGAIEPDHGTIDIAGHRCPGPQRRHGPGPAAAGYLPLPSGLTVTETLELFRPPLRRGRPDHPGRRGARRAAHRSTGGPEGESLSSGQGHPVGFAKAVIHHPRLIVLDEPTSPPRPRRGDEGAGPPR